MAEGDYFNNRTGALIAGQGIQYYKTNQWSLTPGRKGPIPQDVNF